MEQKRFLTADEIFQTFGVDADALQELVNSGAVKALADQGKFRYRAEDFVALVNNGTLSPRTSSEMFISDSDGNIPFLVPEEERSNLGVNEDLSFLELDEDALSEQANPDGGATSDSGLDWLDNSDDSLPEMVLSDDSVEILDASTGAVSGQEDRDDDSAESSVGQLPDSDSDVRIVGFEPDADDAARAGSAVHTESDVVAFSGESDDSTLHKSTLSDSDVVLVKAPGAPDSDSDVRLSGFDAQDESDTAKTTILTEGASEDGIRLFASPSDSDVSLVGEDDDVKRVDTKGPVTEVVSQSDVRLADIDSGISLSDAESGIRLSDDAVSNLAGDSGISLDTGDGISTLSDADSGISLVDDDAVSTLAGDDSGIRLDDSDSGISLLGAESGISLIGADSGIRLQDDDSGIRLDDSGSGISLAGGDSGITFDDDVPPPKPKGPKGKSPVGKAIVSPKTAELSDTDLQDSGFDVSLADEIEQTAELNLRDRNEETPGYPATVVMKTPGKANPVNPTLSETFQMDEPPEVEDLDISDDLEGAVVSDASDEEFAAVEEEEVFEASDDDFSADEVEVADEYLSDDEIAAPVSKVKKGPREPEWGLAAVGPIAFAALTMLATVTVLWGGIATMWTGAEAPGPAATLISTLAGLSPF